MTPAFGFGVVALQGTLCRWFRRKQVQVFCFPWCVFSIYGSVYDCPTLKFVMHLVMRLATMEVYLFLAKPVLNDGVH